MVIRPIWITPAGSLGTFTQGVTLDPILQLEVQNAETVTLISKSLPTGIKLDSVLKTISGTPIDTGITQTYEFVLRASIVGIDGKTYIQDRTFSLTIDSEVQPTLLTPAGTLQVGINSENFILNNSTVNFQFSGTSPSIPDGQVLEYYVEEGNGELPPGLRLSKTGLLYGTIDDNLELDYKLVQGSYDKDYYDINPYDYGASIETAQATTDVLSGKVIGANITYGGNGYLLDPEIIVGGSIDLSSVTITNAGIGYTSAPTIVFSNSPVSGGRTAQGYAVLGPIYGAVPGTSQTELIDGENSNSAVVDTLDGGLSDASFTTLTDGGEANTTIYDVIGTGVVSIVITDQGTGYTSPPTISFKNTNTGSGTTATCTLLTGSGAELVARVSNGTVVKVDVINSGSGYTQPPLISFGLPTAGSRVISKTYNFAVSLTNGELVDTKTYSIFVKSEDALRVDTTFISSDTSEFDASRTYIQAPIWISPGTLPLVKGDNQYIYDLEVFDPTPQTGKLYFSLMDVNFDGTVSQLGPYNYERNQTTFNITNVGLTVPVLLTVAQEHDFKDGDRIKVSNVGGTTEINNGIYYTRVVSKTQLELYSDVILTNEIDGRFFAAYTSGGVVNPETNYLTLDAIGGEINGFIPYQPNVTKTYTFTVKVQRILDDEEVANTFKQFSLTVEGNIQGDIIFTSPTLIGTLKPNELSLLDVVASSTLPSASVMYEVIPGYGKVSEVNYVELELSESNGNILIDGYGINPIMTFEKGQSYKLNLNVDNFNISFRTVDGAYYNNGLRHSSGAVGQAAQEKSSGYYIFIPAFDETVNIKLVYTNTQKNGLVLALKTYDALTREWTHSVIHGYFNEYDAYTNTLDEIESGQDVFVAFLDYTKIQFNIAKYNRLTLSWDPQNIPVDQPADPINNKYWLDLTDSSLGVLDFRYVGLKGVWTPVTYTRTTVMPNNSEGVNLDYKVYNNNGNFSVLRKINNVWKVLEILKYDDKASYDPNVFFRPHTAIAPVTNLQYDVWFKYDCLFDGLDKEIDVKIKSLDNLPTDLSVTLSGEIVGKISPNTGNTYKSYYTGNTLYVVNDVVTFKNSLYICVNQYRSSGIWYQETDNWISFNYAKRTSTTIDVNSYGVGKFSIHGRSGDDNTTIDELFRFRVKAKDTQNVSAAEKDFNIRYDVSTNVTLTNVYLQPFLTKTNRDKYFNFITDSTIFLSNSLYRVEDPSFGIQRIPKMLLLGGLESTTADRYASAVQRNYYDRPLYFGDIKVATAKNADNVEYEVIYVEINDPYEIGNVSVAQSINLGFDYDPLTVDYSKIRVDTNGTVVTDTGLDTIYPSSITLMQNELKNVTLQKNESVLITPNYDDWGSIVGASSETEDWGVVLERVAIEDDFLSAIQTLTNDDAYRPLWMNTSQDGTGNIIGYVKAVPICYVKPGESAKILKLIEKSKFDFKTLNFTIDRIIIQNPQGETGDKYIKFINREII